MMRDGRGHPGTVGDSRGTAWVMSHDAGMIRLEMYDFSLDSTGSPSARTIARYSRSGLHLPVPGVVRPSTPKETGHEPLSVPSSPKGGRTGRLGTLI